ncbi:insulinase family protein [Nakamurella flavida]|uniref:Insulinase family protein n=1 Tax=Nakamurella flavida TaxID=363630 RepID=A0A939C313_9ACTN|nr:pitrilysin family protein [Nakamurella flavida]MBM9477150.1 insulinase family protein [Nakamurella flavida]MDP9780097.1 putative Zn-dependent peptidase [Nakamurella flavida]
MARTTSTRTTSARTADAPAARPAGKAASRPARTRRAGVDHPAAAVVAPPNRSAEQIGRTDRGPRPVPDLSPAGRTREPTLVERVTDSGLTVVAVRKPGTPLVELRLRIPFGGRGDAHAARAELLAATVMLGTGSRSREQVDSDLAVVGGHLDASVDPARLLVSGSALSTGLPVLLEVLADSLLDPAFRRHDVLGERDRLAEYISISASQPSTVARRYLQKQRFGDHPVTLEMPDAQVLAGVGPAAVRGLHTRAVLPAGSTLVLVGDLSPARALDAVEQALQGWRSPDGRTTAMVATPPAVVGGDLVAHHRAGAVQSQVRLTAAAPTREDPGYAAAQIANLVYGGYFSSRLVENIREDKGFTYSAHSGMEFWPGRAAMTIAFDTASDVSAAALLETRYELGRMALTGPTEAEVESARAYALGTLATSLATQAGYAGTLSSLAGVGLDARWLRAHPARLQAVTRDEVVAAAAELFAPTAYTGVVVGDLAVLAPGLSSLGGVVLP